MEKHGQTGKEVRKEAMEKEKRGWRRASHGQPVSASARLEIHPLQHRLEGHERKGRRIQGTGEKHWKLYIPDN